MLSETLKKFGYPKTLIKKYENWLLLCRPKQVTLGSLILICKEEVDAFFKISEVGFYELPKIIKEIETKTKDLFQYDKINYLMLMMHDPEVHFHIIPRYSGEKTFANATFKDFGWPRMPGFDRVNEVESSVMKKLIEQLQKSFAC
ncbi:MAG: hypothetical protein A2445_00605 [Candidatus Jacksonbacteria bacterium RIFOXYC2_FULL_44_29]|nr:MAG: hypothetical protein A2295_03820 [Candidatus Jacksonbacteria bacterium RIFOXYB2_FULL_44_15]OGY76359.1 MAG: hypothetical protein A2240_04335 [Candidatus Jacksonbacteria bacterium RIFOXYA2_FULL_43_12]OGY77997.1 MAG: hypothetical protein A2445_00605 [Candidatus Jacksonbacteria bacterium RIFOXYC2_FULL_44_29]OGY80331.1 MAG: hypothetical protein A2550_04480 [Candidatus Jacksonbacteria bacterium RIFOXYD2_FULL_43_21]HBH46210.1 HIT family protein [Candidatus Jacksonbacteria bacterium]